ncbi:hypothetical protein [Deinococcus pimensis]|uniref:hypothetical protein n=1 Tax=Deinococcus pimensis TaxID=309888 RepID=UPI000485DCE4|nr:hypothetical protein [Deinococcus pimensis]
MTFHSRFPSLPAWARIVGLYSVNALGTALLDFSVVDRAIEAGRRGGGAGTGALLAVGVAAAAQAKFATFLPRALANLLAGPLADRLPQRWMAAVTAGIAVALDLTFARAPGASLGLWSALSLVGAVVTLTLDAAFSRALTSEVTQPEERKRVNALKANATNAARLTAVLVGLALPQVGLGGFALFDALTYALVGILGMNVLRGSVNREVTARGLLDAYRAGYLVPLRWVLGPRRLVPLVICYLMWGMAEVLRPAVISIVQPDRAAATAALATTLGAWLGSFLAARLIRPRRPGMSLHLARLGAAGLAIVTLVLSVRGAELHTVGVVFGLLVVYAVLGEFPWLWLDNAITHEAPSDVRGRTKATAMVAGQFVTSSVAVGATATSLTVMAAPICGAGLLLALLWNSPGREVS